MADSIFIESGKGIKSNTGIWYKCLEPIGAGGNAATFLVLCTSGQSKGLLFAMKVFRKLSKPERRDSFFGEISFLKSTNHPSIMRVFDEGLYYEYPFVVAEYLPETFRQVIRNPPSIVKRVSYAIQLLSGLAYLACLQPQVVHRDLKPQNVFVKGGSCVLGDFGLMKKLDGNMEIDREILKESIGVGMPFYYRTPDLVDYALNKCPLTTKTDVFQLGLVLAELFTGFNPEKPAETVYDPVELNPIGNINSPSYGAGIATLLKRMLILNPAERPNASDLMDTFQAILFDSAMRSKELEGHAF